MDWIYEHLNIKPAGWLIKRNIDRKQFIIGNKNLCREAFNIGTDHKSYKSISGSRLVEMARKELKYKDSTYSGDIYFGLWRTYEELFCISK